MVFVSANKEAISYELVASFASSNIQIDLCHLLT